MKGAGFAGSGSSRVVAAPETGFLEGPGFRLRVSKALQMLCAACCGDSQGFGSFSSVAGLTGRLCPAPALEN